MIRVFPIIIVLLSLLILAIGVILIAQRSKSTTKLTFWLILSGITGSVLNAFIIFHHQQFLLRLMNLKIVRGIQCTPLQPPACAANRV